MKDKQIGYIVLFKHGRCVGTFPPLRESYYDRREIIYNARIIRSDGVIYDLADEDSIFSIKIPTYNKYKKNKVSEELGVTGYLEYVLKMRASGYKNDGNDALCYACLGVSTYLMANSERDWNYEDFFRIVEWLERDGDYESADNWRQWIAENVPTPGDRVKAHFQKALNVCELLETDLIELLWEYGQCGTVSKYQGRVYSISGKDKRFPLLPDFIKQNGAVVPPIDGIEFFAFTNSKTVKIRGEEIPALEASWRPFVDDRTPTEKEMYRQRYIKIATDKAMKENVRMFDKIRKC